MNNLTTSKERLLITGSTGLVGSYLSRILDSQYNVFNLVHNEQMGIGRSIVADLSNPQIFAELIQKIRPDIIIHLAAMTNVDQCELQRTTADNINHLSVKQIASYVRNNPQCFVLYVSTDYVFDGIEGSYDEQDQTNPINWYGVTKLLGEKELIQCGENWCIARTSTPFGVHNKKQSFPIFVIKNLCAGQRIKVLTDQITSPTYAANLVEMLKEIVDRKIKGIIHTSGSSQISRFDQAVQIASFFRLDANSIQPVTSNEMNWNAPRPKNSSLSIKKASRILTKKPITFEEGIIALSKEIAEIQL